MKTIRQEQYDLLKKVLEKSAPDLISLADKVGRESLPAAERKQMQAVLGDELAAFGVGENGEINNYGLQLDQLISLVAKFSDDWA